MRAPRRSQLAVTCLSATGSADPGLSGSTYSPIDARVLLQRLRQTDRNFDPRDVDAAQPERHWRVDRYRCELVAEPPGDPVRGCPWSIACDLNASYSFVDPSIVRSIFDPSEPLEDRTLLLEVHFGLAQYTLGCAWEPFTT
jgi:hypothetical protein